MSLEHQVIIIYAVTQGYMDDLPVEQVKKFEEGFHEFVDDKYPDVC